MGVLSVQLAGLKSAMIPLILASLCPLKKIRHNTNNITKISLIVIESIKTPELTHLCMETRLDMIQKRLLLILSV